MNWFKKKYSVCEQCQVHFEPTTFVSEAKWKNLCPTHRKPVMEKDLRKDAVIRWAINNWENLEPQYKEEINKSNQISQSNISEMMKEQLMKGQYGLSQASGLNALAGSALGKCF